jgi:hypothetical protein
MKKLFSLVIAFLMISGCTDVKERVTREQLVNHIFNAAAGDKGANKLLSELFNVSELSEKLPEIIIDTLSFNSKVFYAAAVRFPGEVVNYFALYDEYLNCYIIDRSLNGTIKLSTLSDPRCFTLEENYFTNDSIELKRFSIYSGDSSGFNLSFRTFTMMRTVDTVFQHNLKKISADIISTRISAPQFSGLNNFSDDYLYDKNLKKYYVGKAVYFDEFVTSFVNSIKDTLHMFADYDQGVYN